MDRDSLRFRLTTLPSAVSLRGMLRDSLALRLLLWMPVACGDDGATTGGGGAGHSGTGGDAPSTSTTSSGSTTGSGGAGEGGGAVAWERTTGAFVVDLEVTPDGGVILYAVGSEQDLAATSRSTEPVQGAPGLVAKLSPAGETEWVYPLPTTSIQYSWLATSPAGGAAVTLQDPTLRLVYLEDGAEVWTYPFNEGGTPRFDFDSGSQLWTRAQRASANGLSAHAGSLPFASVHAVESHVVYAAAEVIGAAPHLESYALDGTTPRFDIAATMNTCDGCWANINPVQLENGSTVMLTTIVDPKNPSAPPTGSVDWGCPDTSVPAIVAIDDRGSCLWSKPITPEQLALQHLAFGPSGDGILVAASGELQRWSGESGAVLETWPMTFPNGDGTPNGEAVYTRAALTNATVIRRVK
ncbi:MAG: hypothetical protein JNL21_29265 [Myxococcales bacterium]|nr:hypothetical protein [Myxococcales bacterium]